MRWIMGIIYIVGIYPILLAMYFSLRGAGEGKGGYCFAVSVKKEWLENAEIREIQKNYRRELKKTALIFAVIPLFTFALPTFSIPFTIWMLWMVAVCIVPFLPLVRANGRMKAWKRENGFCSEKAHVVYTEMKNAGDVRKVKPAPFLPPMLLSAGVALWSVVHFGRMELLIFGGMIVLLALITFSCYGIAVWMDRQKTQVISSDSDVNLNYARAKKNLWKNLWLWMAWLNTIYTAGAAVVFAVEEFATVWFLWGSIGYGVLAFLLLLWFAKRGSIIETRYETEREEIYTDDDDVWLGGIIYYNKQDKRTMVPKRTGIGTTTNLATPMGKLWDGIGIATLLLVLPIMCIWLMLEEFTPIRLSVINHVLTAEQLSVNYEIPVEEMEHIAIIDEKPRWTKISGTGLDNLCKGTFRVQGEKCELFLNPQNDLLLRIETAEKTYYMSASDDDGTQELYELLMEAKK